MAGLGGRIDTETRRVEDIRTGCGALVDLSSSHMNATPNDDAPGTGGERSYRPSPRPKSGSKPGFDRGGSRPPAKGGSKPAVKASNFKPSKPVPEGMVRLQRILADAGIAARRTCEEMIEYGRVSVNGKVVSKLPAFANPETDSIAVDGKPIPRPERHVYVMLNKPSKVLSTVADEPGMDRATVLTLVQHPAAPRLVPVGRLDYETTGLVLLTNDGEMIHRLTHPKYEVPKVYHILVKGTIDQDRLELLRSRLRHVTKREEFVTAREEGKRPERSSVRRERADRIGIEIVRSEENRTLLAVTVFEAQTVHLVETLQSVGLPVKKMARVALGPLVVKSLPLGNWRELTREEIQMLRAKPNQKPEAIPDFGKMRQPRVGEVSEGRSRREAAEQRNERAGINRRPSGASGDGEGRRPEPRSGVRAGPRFEPRHDSRDVARPGPREGTRGGARPAGRPAREGDRPFPAARDRRPRREPTEGFEFPPRPRKPFNDRDGERRPAPRGGTGRNDGPRAGFKPGSGPGARTGPKIGRKFGPPGSDGPARGGLRSGPRTGPGSGPRTGPKNGPPGKSRPPRGRD